MKTYITGATGRLGRVVLSKFPQAIPLVRKPSCLPNEIVTDFSEKQLKDIFKDATTIIHIAGSVETHNTGKLQQANVELTRKIVDAAPKDSRIIFASSISVYGKNPERIPADENTPVHPDSAYARSKYEAEQIVCGVLNHVILRIGTIYGPQFEDYPRILSMLERGKMQIIGSGDNRIPFVHVEDVADAIVNSVTHGMGIYVLAGEPLSQKQIYAIACSLLGVPEPKKQVSLGTAMLHARLNEWKSGVLGKVPKMSAEHISILGADRVFNCIKARRELGFIPRPLDVGIIEIARIYKRVPPPFSTRIYKA